MQREKGLIIDGKMLSDFNRFGKEIWKKIPPVTHSFKVGDRVICTDSLGKEKGGVVVEIDGIEKKWPYETLSTLTRYLVVLQDDSTRCSWSQDYLEAPLTANLRKA